MSNKWNNIIREKLESHEVSADHLWNNIHKIFLNLLLLFGSLG